VLSVKRDCWRLWKWKINLQLKKVNHLRTLCIQGWCKLVHGFVVLILCTLLFFLKHINVGSWFTISSFQSTCQNLLPLVVVMYVDYDYQKFFQKLMFSWCSIYWSWLLKVSPKPPTFKVVGICKVFIVKFAKNQTMLKGFLKGFDFL
jgi:hypothetical protein